MEAVGSVAAVLQLVQAVGKTVISVSQIYHDIRDIDDTLRDFDSQLNATKMMLSILSDGIQCSTFGPSTPPWWNRDVLEGLLNSCNRSYSRLGTIFANISRQRSPSTALWAYIRKRRYDGDISLLRDSIDTYTSALRLPVLIQTIQGCSAATAPQPPTGDIATSFNELMHRIDSLQSSMDRLDRDLITRALRRTNTQTTTSPQKERPGDTQAELDTVDQKEKLDMENDTRATLGVLKGLMGHAKFYASSIESASTSSRLTQPSSKAKVGNRDTKRAGISSTSRLNVASSPEIDFGTRLPPKKRRDVSDWAGNVDHRDNFSSASLDSSLPSVTATSQSAFSTSTKGTSLLGELHERRIQTAERFMKEKMFDKAIPHLERLLSSSSDPEFDQNASQSARSLAKALVHSRSDDSKVEAYCQKFPFIRTWLDEYRLKHGLYLLKQGQYDDAVVLLQSYRTGPASQRSFEKSPIRPADSMTMTRHKIQITLCRALLRSSKSIDKGEPIPILKQLLQWNCLDSADKGEALSLLAEAHHLKGNFEHAKSNGIQACQIKMDTLGRDHEETAACIALMANICLDNNDPDEDLWRGMLSQSRPTNDGVDASPSRFIDIRNRIDSCIREMQKLGTKNPKLAAEFGVKYLKENYCPILSQDMPNSKIVQCRDWTPSMRECLSNFFFFGRNLLCWACLGQHLAKTQTFAAIQVGAACPFHKYGQPSDFTGLSPFHFFAMAIPRPGKWEPRRGENCVEEMDAILRIAEMTNPGSLATSRIINATMHYGIKSKAVSALWVAATHENEAVVDFLLSRGEMNAAQGTAIIQHTTYNPGRRREIGLFKLFERRTSPIPASQGLSKPFLKAFDALTSNEARQLLRSPGPREWPWWFSCPFMLDNFLRKCGRGNGDVQRDFASLFRLFVQAVAIPSLNPYPLLLESSDIEKLFWTLWEHGTKAKTLRFMMSPIHTTIDSAPHSCSQRACVAVRERLRLWFSILNQLLSKNVKFDGTCRRILEQCCGYLYDERPLLRLCMRNIHWMPVIAVFPEALAYHKLRTLQLVPEARRSRGVSRARDAWKMGVGDAKGSEIERADMIDLLWNFLDQTPCS